METQLEPLSKRRMTDFLDAVRRSRKLHRNLVYAPDSEERFGDLLKRGRRQNCAQFLISLEGSAELVGFVEISSIVRGFFDSAFLGYYAFKPHAGKGLMREGLAKVIDRAFGPLALHRLEANIQPANERSINLVKSLGFRLEGFSPRYLRVAGVWRDHERWALLSDEWQSPKARI
jgi:ribosomal-protein-alanine N-acetyltransferase